MSTATTSKSALAVASLLLAVAGCDSSIRVPISSPTPAALNGADRYEARPGVLRARQDSARGRIWALHADGVDLYDARSDQKLRAIALPEWVWADELHSCPPDLAVGPEGEVIVSSNVVPVLWRIDPTSFVVSRHELAVLEDKGREVGFSGVTYSARQGAFFGVNGLDGSLWRIDLALRRAQPIPLSSPISRACSVSAKSGVAGARLGTLCVQAEERAWTVHLAPDYRSGYAHAGSCSAAGLSPTAKLQTIEKTF